MYEHYYVRYEFVVSRGHIHAHLITQISTTKQFYMDQLNRFFYHEHNHCGKDQSPRYKCRYNITNQWNGSNPDQLYNITMPIVNESRIRTYAIVLYLFE